MHRKKAVLSMITMMVIVLTVSNAATIHHHSTNFPMNPDQSQRTKAILPDSSPVERSSDEFVPEKFLASGKMASTDFDNIPSQFIGPNYSFGNSRLPIITSGQLPLGISVTEKSTLNNLPIKDEKMDLLGAALRRYDMKRYLLKKILGNSHDLDEDIDGGFFSNKHLKRHGTAGVAAKVLGELIGIKIRESIEGFGKSFSEYAKDFTARNFVNAGQLFGKLFRFSQP
ncbi:uncharacterized protein LOC113798093 isoform X3 [Dermatophagoides pteronyssinus]|uniref:uncharacterized protein LOC113798093 isoform X3 n=1 Tax=Dermatophagoides pteronyssinus TaxID=6956 RepID=UPI003F669B85